MKILCLAGLIGSGKDETAKYIAEKYGYHIIDYANILRDICKKEGLEITRENLQNLRIKYGNTFLAEEVVKRVKESKKEKILLTPIRRSEDYEIPKKEFPSLKMILIEADQKLRFTRLKKRKRENDPQDFKSFQNQEKREKEIFNFDKTFSYAEYVIKNNKGLEQLRKNINKIMKEIEGEKMKIIIMGPQGSGKGTHAKKLATKLGIVHISTGDLLRELANKKTKEGMKVKKMLSSGSLLPDDFVLNILKKRIMEKDAKNGYIIDGFPRTLKQAEMMEDIKIDIVLYLNVSDKECIRRLGGRLTCKKCGAIYGNENPPKKKGICDLCNGELYVREDDKEDVIKKRLSIYHKETEPILDFYRKKNILIEVKIDKIMTPEETFNEICKALKI